MLCLICVTALWWVSIGATVNVGIHPSKVVITKLKTNKSRKAILERKKRESAAEKGKGKFTDADVAGANLGGVD